MNIIIIINHVGRRGFESVCLFVYLSVCPEHNSKMKDPNVFKLGISLGYSRSGRFGIERSKVKVTGSISTFFILLPAAKLKNE